LLSELFSIGPTQFQREYQHNVIDDESALVKLDWLTRACNRGKHMALRSVPQAVDKEGEFTGLPLDLIVLQAWDLSLVTDKRRAEENDRDYTIGMTWGYDKVTKDRYLLGLARFRGVGPKELVRRIIEEYHFFSELGLQISQVRVEHNAFGELYYGDLAGSGLPLVAHQTTGTNKNNAVSGVAALSSILDTNRVILPQKDVHSKEMMNLLVEEVYMLGKARHDDIPMCWWIAESGLRVNAVGQSIHGAQPLVSSERLEVKSMKTTYDWGAEYVSTRKKSRFLR
jgi:phage terminase large subunit-like protein